MASDIRLEVLDDLIERHPGWAPALEELGIDGRDGTGLTLAAAADRAGVDVDTVVAALPGPTRARRDCDSLDGVPVRVLVDHIEQVHHEFLRSQFQLVAQLIDEARHDDPTHAGLVRLADGLTELRGDLEPHILSEETTLFPLCRDIADAFSWPSFHTGPIVDPIQALRHDHADANRLLDDLLALVADEGQAGEAGQVGAGHAELVAAINDLDSDLRRHLDEENELLFPRVLALAAELNEA
jgi:regulator of cell morphogenesis and NO signaling